MKLQSLTVVQFHLLLHTMHSTVHDTFGLHFGEMNVKHLRKPNNAFYWGFAKKLVQSAFQMDPQTLLECAMSIHIQHGTKEQISEMRANSPNITQVLPYAVFEKAHTFLNPKEAKSAQRVCKLYNTLGQQRWQKDLNIRGICVPREKLMDLKVMGKSRPGPGYRDYENAVVVTHEYETELPCHLLQNTSALVIHDAFIRGQARTSLDIWEKCNPGKFLQVRTCALFFGIYLVFFYFLVVNVHVSCRV